MPPTSRRETELLYAHAIPELRRFGAARIKTLDPEPQRLLVEYLKQVDEWPQLMNGESDGRRPGYR